MSIEKRELPVLRTKLNKPALGSDWIARPHLVAQLAEGWRTELIFVVAPAGFGKSTLLVEWLSKSSTPPSAWLSLDEQDNDLPGFINYFTAAIQTVFPEACSRTRTLLLTTPAAELDDLLIPLLFDLEALPDHIILVLDDYHTIHLPAIHQLIDVLVSHRLERFHLVISSRHSPPLALSRLRARGQLTELRASHLRFNADETHAFLRRALRKPLNTQTVELVEARTEGWPAGIRMAALSLRDANDDPSFLQGLQDLRSHVIDYLIEEVLTLQDAQTLDFLLRTSMLERMCAPLCDTLLDSAPRSQKLLAKLEAANLFIVPLDREQGWYRYHHLFGVALQHRLRMEHGSAQEHALRLRAATWLEENNCLEEAVQQALAAHDAIAAAKIVERQAHPLLNRRLWRRLKHLLSMLPQDLIPQRPGLIIAQCRLVNFDDVNIDIEQTLKRAEALLQTNPDGQSEAEINVMRGDIASLWANYLGSSQSNIERGIEEGRRALALTPPNHIQPLTLAANYLSFMLHATGRQDEAKQVIEDTLNRVSDPFGRTALLRTDCYLRLRDGHLQQAIDLCAIVRKQASECGDVYIMMQMQCVMMNVHYERNELAEIEGIYAGLPVDAEIIHPYTQREALRCLALTQAAQGKRNEAKQTAQKLLELSFEYGDGQTVGIARSLIAHVHALLGEATDWVAAPGYYNKENMTWTYVEVPPLTRALMSIQTGKPDMLAVTVQTLHECLDNARSTHNRRHEIRILALLALAAFKQHDLSAALALASQAIELNQPCGMLRPFLELGPDMARLLRELGQRMPNDEWITRLLSAFPPAPSANLAPPAELKWHDDVLVEPLSRREMEVLHLLGRRFSDKEIAESLSISPLTVKSHTYRIYSKLGVNSRRKAVARAQAMGILNESAVKNY